MNVEHDLRRAFRRKTAPPEFADRVRARIEQRDRSVGDTVRIFGRVPALRWLGAAAAVTLIAAGGARYYVHDQTIAEAERVRAEIRLALQITSEKLSLPAQGSGCTTIAEVLMKIAIVLLVLLLVASGTVRAQGARLQLDHLDRLGSQASESVNISIDPAMLKLASGFLKGDGDEAAVKELLNGLKGIYVKVFEFDRENVYTPEDLNAVRRQLASPGWSRLVTVDSKRDRELVEVYSWREGNESGGLAILVAEPMELTVVNIVGPMDLTKLGALQGQFGIPRLPPDAGSSGR